MNTNFMNNVIKHSFNLDNQMFNQNEEILHLTQLDLNRSNALNNLSLISVSARL